MLTEITLDRFKCFNHLYMPLKPLTLIAGVNGAGKSSVIQALLMLVQSCRDKDYDWKEHVVINGDLTDLDNARFLMYNSADADKGTVDVTVENDGEQQISFAITPKQTDRVATCVTEGNLMKRKRSGPCSQTVSCICMPTVSGRVENMRPRLPGWTADWVISLQTMLHSCLPGR